MHRARALAPVLSFPLLSAFALAQAPVRHVEGLAAAERLGLSVAAVGDLDGDLIPDFITGAPYANTAGGSSGRVLFVSGADASVLHNIGGGAAGDLFGCAVAGVGDVDGDLVPDVLVGARGEDGGGSNAGAAYLLSGVTGTVLWVVRGQAGDNLGVAVTGLGDVNGDLVPDVAVGAWTADPNGQNSGAVYILDGATGALLHLLPGEAAYDFFGGALANAGDIDGDGVNDVLVGARWNGFAGSGAGSAYVHSGATGARLLTLRGGAAGDAFGTAVTGVGDMDGDGTPDVAVGAPGADGGGANAGSAYIFSGATGATLRTLHGEAPGDSFGSALAALHLDADGLAELAVGALASDETAPRAGSVRVYSGFDGSQVGVLYGGQAEVRFGAALARFGDLDGDGMDELLVGAYGDNGKGAMTGAAQVCSFMVDPIEIYCSALPNSTGVGATIGHGGSVSVAASDLRFVVTDLPLSQFGLFYYGKNGASAPFGNGIRCVGGLVFRLQVVAFGQTRKAEHQLNLANPPEPAGAIQAGSTWRFQLWYRDPAGGGDGFNLSNALRATFAP